jgi:hypothetical protein
MSRVPKLQTKAARENPISVAHGVERNSGMDRADLANLTASVAVTDQRSFRAAARLGVTPSALGRLGLQNRSISG